MARKLVKYSVVNAFTDSAFKGNPAAVCLLEEEREEQWLQAVAAEFNISVTCYLTRIVESTNASIPRFRIKYFTSITQVKTCGHATLAAAHTLFTSSLADSSIIEFETPSGILTVKKIPEKNIISASEFKNGESQDGFSLELDFPADTVIEFNFAETSEIHEAFEGASIIDLKRSTILDDIFVVVPSGKSVTELKPQLHLIRKFPGRGVTVTGLAPKESGFDFYSRFFAPKLGVDEDPVCGSAHCALASYWSKKLEKCDLKAYQVSPRGGVINIHLDEQNQRVLLRGNAVTVMEGCLLV